MGVFLTDIGVDCCVTVAFMDRWHPDIVVKVLYAPESTGECHAPSSGHPL